MENSSFEGFVKKSLEEDAGVGADTLAAVTRAAERAVSSRRSRLLAFRFGGASLLAASLTLAVAWSHLAGGVSDRPDVSDVIGLLCEADGVSRADMEGDLSGDLLLAWQEVPCDMVY